MKVDLPTPGTPVMPTRRALPACGSSSTSSCWASSRWSAPGRLDQRDGPRDVRAPGPRPARPRRTVGRRVDRHSSWPEPPASRSASRSRAASAITVPGGKIAAAPAARSVVEVLRRDDPADHDHDVVAAQRGQLVAQRRHQREVPGGQRVDADDVHVGLDRLAGDLAGRLEQRADVDVEAEVGERGGDHLLAAVVAVLAHLGDQDPRPAALGLARTPRPAARVSLDARGRSRPRRGTRRRSYGSAPACRP